MTRVNGMMMRLAWSAMLGGLALAAAGPVRADVKAGVDAWSRGEYEAAVREWRGPAERGDPDAMFNLAQAYKLGRGVPADLARAEDLFGKAAAKGHPQASDNYGLLLFQRGERQRALPYIESAAKRGDPRAQYLLGLAHFNGDNVPKDWVRAYALVTLAQQAGLPQAPAALRQMDSYIPLDQRQRSVPLAARLRDEARATRSQALAAADLGAAPPSAIETPPPASASRSPAIASAEQAVAVAARAAGADSPRTAGADYARPPSASPAPIAPPRAAAPPVTRTPPATPTPTPASPAPASPAAGSWRIQLGAFGQPGNAEALWKRVSGRPELAGRGRLLVPAGRVTKLQAGGFASQGAAQAACARLVAAGFACIPVRN